MAILSTLGAVGSALLSSGVASGVLTGLAQNRINQANIDFQRQENAITRQREDNAITRQIADLRNAGMSPLLASGQGASAQSLTAPQFGESSVAKGVQNAIAFRQAKGQLDLIHSQVGLHDAQKLGAIAQADLSSAQADAVRKETEWMQKFGYRNQNPVAAFTNEGYKIFNALNESPEVFEGTVNAVKEGSKDVYDKAKNSVGHVVVKSAAKIADALDKDHYYKAKGKRMIHVQE